MILFKMNDIDGDGQTVEEGDCDDNDPNIFWGAEGTLRWYRPKLVMVRMIMM